MQTATNAAKPMPEVMMALRKPHSSAPRTPMVLKKVEPPMEKPRVVEEVIIEEVSIDGMCGVY